MAVSSTSVLFSVVLLALVVKHVAGMRGSQQAASMLETEVTWWGNKCAQFGAEVDVDYENFCRCPFDRPITTKECGDYGTKFNHSKATKGCQCVTEVEALERLKMPVAASALRFCEALAEGSYRAEGNNMRWALKKTSPEICQHALVGTITPQEAKEAPFAKKASELSQHGNDEDGNQDRAYGRMRSVKEDATDPTEKDLWEHALSQVCKDECTDLLDMMKKEAEHLEQDVYKYHVPFAQTCAERVVQHVEAEILGCCGRSCGYNGRRCLLWPFFSPEEKVDWQLECCAEISILKNSSRELMCNSVLPDRLAKKASNFDLEEQNGTDIGKVLIGQNTSLFWTQEGAQEARSGIKLQLPKKSVLIKEKGALADKKVSMEFLLKHPNVGEEFLRHGYIREEPLNKILNEATSIMQVSSQDDTCNFGKFEEKCPQKFMTTFVKKCNEAWNVTQESEDAEETFRDLLLHEKEGNCIESDSQNFATPEDCEKSAKNSGEIFLHYFTYNNENKDLPIKCFSLSKEQCKGKDDWWKRIPLVSVQELMNKQDVNAYAELVYIKVKAN